MPSLEFGTRMVLRECWMNERVMVTIKTFVLHHLWGNGTPLQYSCLENPLDGGACWAAVHGVAKSQTRLSDFTVTFHFHALEEEMATRSSVLAWRIPGTGEPGGLPSMGSHRVRHDWSNLAAAASIIIWHQIPNLWKTFRGNVEVLLNLFEFSCNIL